MKFKDALVEARRLKGLVTIAESSEELLKICKDNNIQIGTEKSDPFHDLTLEEQKQGLLSVLSYVPYMLTS